MRKYVHWIILGGILVVMVAWRSLAASSETQMMTPRASEEWSRGQFIGHTPVKQPVTIQPAPDRGVFVVWPNLDGRLELVHIGGDGKVVLDRVLPVEARKARGPQLEVGSEGRLHLLWREQGSSRASIRYALLETDGTPVSQPLVLSDSASRVLGAPQLAQDINGHLHALWADDDGVHWAVLSRDGERLQEPTLLIPEGHSLLLQVDDGGRLHLAWQQKKRINVQGVYYAVLDPEKGELSDAEEITEIVINDRMRIEDVAFGLSHDTGYVFWSEYDEAFDHYFFPYISFSLDIPRQKQANFWRLEIGDGPTAIAMPDGQHTPLQVALSERVIGLEPVSGNELAHYLIANESAVASGEELSLQISLISTKAERDGTVEQIVTASPSASMKPVLAIDARSYRHLVWLETGGFGQYRLIYASTVPKVLEEYNALTPWDIVNMMLSKIFRLSLMVVTVILTFIMWAIIPLLALAGYHLLTSEETLDTTRSRVVLGVVLAVEVALTFVLPPRIAGVDTILPILRWGIPSVATVVAAAVTASFVRCRKDAHLFVTFFLFTILISLLQMALYLLF
jgi:hypothetical protein